MLHLYSCNRIVFDMTGKLRLTHKSMEVRSLLYRFVVSGTDVRFETLCPCEFIY